MENTLTFLGGFFSIMLLHLSQVGLSFALDKWGRHGMIPDTFLLFISFGILQWVYVAPALWFASHYQHDILFWGMLTAALLTVAIQVFVWFLVFGGSGSIVP